MKKKIIIIIIILLVSPRTTALAPTNEMPLRLINSMHPFGVQGTNPVLLLIAVLPSFIVCNLCFYK